MAAGALLGVTLSAMADVHYAGSDTVEPIIEAANVAFARGHSGFKLSQQANGSASGLRDLCASRAAIVGASRAIKPDEAKACASASVNYVELPVALDAIALIVPLSNTWLKELKLEEVKALFDPASTGKLSSWRQLRPGYPDTPIRPAGVGIKHATFTFFSESVGLNGFIRSDYKDTNAHASTGKYVAGEAGGVGFVPLGDALSMSGQVRVVPINFGAGPITPTTEAVQGGAYDRLARNVYLYVNANMLASMSAMDAEFVKYVVGDTAKLVQFANLIPLRPMQYRENQQRLAR
jgi:phosphate transport system substrate-binding protein